MDRLADRVCVALCLLTLAYLLYHVVRAGWIF